MSKYIADKAVERGVTLCLNSPVEKFITSQRDVQGVIVNGKELKAKKIITNCDLYTTYFSLMDENQRKDILDKDKINSLEAMNYESPVMKINLIVDKLPQFKCFNSLVGGDFIANEHEYNTNIAMNHLTGTIHMNAESIQAIDTAYQEALSGKPSTKPIIEMTIPSLLDKTLVPEGSKHHVIGLFCQYAPNKLNVGIWNQQRKKDFANRIYDEINKYAPGFSKSILFEDILSPTDLENEFSIRGGNIFHGSMELNSIFFCRPFPGFASYKHTNNLYSCSSGMHPGGGVMGAAGRNCAMSLLDKL